MVGVKIGPVTTLASAEAHATAKTMKIPCATTVDRASGETDASALSKKDDPNRKNLLT
jgi:hypothetical protein